MPRNERQDGLEKRWLCPSIPVIFQFLLEHTTPLDYGNVGKIMVRVCVDILSSMISIKNLILVENISNAETTRSALKILEGRDFFTFSTRI